MRKTTTRKTYTCVWCGRQTSNKNKVCTHCHFEDFYAAQNLYRLTKAQYADMMERRKALAVNLPPFPEDGAPDAEYEAYADAEAALDREVNYDGWGFQLRGAEDWLLNEARAVILEVGADRPAVLQAADTLYANLRKLTYRQRLLDLVARFDPSK